MIIRIFLIASIALAFLWLLQRPSGNRLAITRLAGLLVAGAAVVGVLAPDLVTRAAHLVGVREGPNLLLYVLIVVFTFTSLAQSARIRHLEHRIAELARAHALLDHKVSDRAEETGRVALD